MTVRALRAGLVVVSAWIAVGVAGTTAGAQNVSVAAAEPASGTQDTVGLVVKITGKNFAPGARSQFFLSGTTNPDGIVVRGTQFVSVTEVDATIDIAATASLASFDIKVANTNGRSGKGSDLFQVVQKAAGTGPSCMNGGHCAVMSLSVQFLDADASGTNYPVRSDGLGPYYDGVDGVKARLPSSGAFQFDTGTMLPAIRDMVIEYAFPLAGSLPYTLLVGPGAHYYWQSNGLQGSAFQELGTPGWPSSMCVSGYFKPEDAFEAYATLFHTGIEGASTTITGRWLVTRVGPTSWTIETSPICSGDIVNLRHRLVPAPKKGDTYETIGYYHLPFKMLINTQ